MTFLSHFSFSSRRAAVMMMGLKIDNNVITTSSHTYIEFYFIKKSVPADFRRPASPLEDVSSVISSIPCALATVYFREKRYYYLLLLYHYHYQCLGQYFTRRMKRKLR